MPTISIHEQKQQIDQLKFQLDVTYKRDKRALERALEIIEKNYEDQKRAIEHLERSVNDPESRAPEYFPPENPTEMPPAPQIRRDTEEGMETIPLPKKEGKLASLVRRVPEAGPVLELARGLGIPFSLRTMIDAWDQAIDTEPNRDRIKLALLQLTRGEYLESYKLKTLKGPVTYYQDVRAKTPIKTALARQIQAKKVRAEVQLQQPAPRQRLTEDEVEALPADERIELDAGAVKRSPAQTPLDPDAPVDPIKRRRRRERR